MRQLLTLYEWADGTLTPEHVRQTLASVGIKDKYIEPLITRFTQERLGSDAGRKVKCRDPMDAMRALLDDVQALARAAAQQDSRLPVLTEITRESPPIGREFVVSGEMAIPEPYAETARQLFFSGEEWMERALYDQRFGFYSTGLMQFGSDFTTEPVALSPYFGAMVAEQIYQLWLKMDSNGTLDRSRPF